MRYARVAVAARCKPGRVVDLHDERAIVLDVREVLRLRVLLGLVVHHAVRRTRKSTSVQKAVQGTIEY